MRICDNARACLGHAAIVLALVAGLDCGGNLTMKTTPAAHDSQRQGWIRMIGIAEADGPLREIYTRMKANSGSRPAAYNTPTGDAANIVKAHSLEPEGLKLAFGISSAIHWSDKSLPWVQREMINTVTSRANNCFY
jgi:hypothetical protein